MKDKKILEPYAEEMRILRNARMNNKLVVFVGAGTSFDSGMPSWSEAIKIIADRLGIMEEQLDYIKIPQYYYNSRGKKEYAELMREIFKCDDDLDIQDVHKKIIQLNAHTIITTNYDSLIEKAATSALEFIQVISQDKDMPYKKDGKELIKMHGDFVHDNFVLKEDDYLHYSSNFKLIEAYVKALLATNVVLFIGYSFNDPDVKQIFSWVKDILDEDMQRAYMLDVTKQYDEYEFEYYKNLGINVIYASKWETEFDKSYASLYTNNFLERILEEKQEKRELLYKECKVYSELNYICLKYIKKLFRNYEVILDGTELSSSCNSLNDTNVLLKELYDDANILDKTEDVRNSQIKEVIAKSLVERVELYSESQGKTIKRKEIEIEKKPESKIFELIKAFDFDGLRKIRNENELNLSEISPELYLEQAYISYVIFEDVRAYQYLRYATKIFYNQKKYVWYFITEVNRKNIGRLVVGNLLGGISEAERDKISKEARTIDIKKVYKKISAEKCDMEFLQEISTFNRYFSLFQDIYRIGKKTEKEARTTYELYAGIPGYEKLRESIKDCYEYDSRNYIMMDRFREDIEIYRKYAGSIIISACNSPAEMIFDRQEDQKAGNISVKELEKFDIYIILKYMEQKELETVLYENCKNTLTLNVEAMEYLNDVVFKISKINNYQYKYLSVYLTLVAYIKLNEKIVANILEVLKEHITSIFVIQNYRMITKIIERAEDQGVLNKESHSKLLEDLIERLIRDLAVNSSEVRKVILLSWYMGAYKQIDKSYYSDTLLELVKKDDYSMLTKLYMASDDTIRKEIKKTCANWKWENNDNQVECYKDLVLYDMIEADSKVEKDLLEQLKVIEKKTSSGILSSYDTIVQVLAILYLNNKVELTEQIEKMIKDSDNEMSKWLIDMENYDYNNFEVSWLEISTNSLLRSIAKCETAKKKICKKIRDRYMRGDVDKKILSIYFKYFVDSGKADH